jgi:hypothetical protein
VGAAIGDQLHGEPMPRYYFNLYNDEVTTDHEGIELADDRAARSYAVQQVRAVAADSVLNGHITASRWLEIVDEDLAAIACVRVDEAVDFRP